MGIVTIHAGMPKTGSSSVQEWLRRAAPRLAADHGLHLLHDSGNPYDPSTHLQPYERGPFSATQAFVIAYAGGRDAGLSGLEMAEVARGFCEELDAHATSLGSVIISSEGLSTPIAECDTPFAEALQWLAGRHQVRFVYYVRRQDETLESRWRQWGYKNDLAPSAWVSEQISQIRYAESLLQAEAIAGDVEFELRPFGSGLLHGGDVVVDFAHKVLGIYDLDLDAPLDENPGISLDMAILLRAGPKRLTASPGTESGATESGMRQVTLGQVTREWNLAESAAAVESRRVLQAAARSTFEEGNRVLIDRFKWSTDEFIPAIDHAGDFNELDRLWSVEPTVSTQHFYAAIEELCLDQESSGS